MKINPQSISAYRQTDQLAANNARTNRGLRSGTDQPAQPETTVLAPTPRTGSSIAVAPKTNTYADTLTEAERAAFDLVFQKYQSLQSAAPREQADTQLGLLIDVKI